VQARVGQPADAHGEVEGGPRDVDGQVGELQVDPQVRVLGLQLAEQRRDVRPAETDRGLDGDPAAQARCWRPISSSPSSIWRSTEPATSR
jgi:hypothetical protein